MENKTCLKPPTRYCELDQIGSNTFATSEVSSPWEQAQSCPAYYGEYIGEERLAPTKHAATCSALQGSPLE